MEWLAPEPKDGGQKLQSIEEPAACAAALAVLQQAHGVQGS